MSHGFIAKPWVVLNGGILGGFQIMGSAERLNTFRGNSISESSIVLKSNKSLRLRLNPMHPKTITIS